MSKIKVPEGMVDAAIEALRVKWGYRVYVTMESHRDNAETSIRAALQWLSKNPIVPTEEQILLEAKATRPVDVSMYIQWIAWWQRHCFLTPEPIGEWTDKFLAQFPSGYTPTHDELDKLWNNIFRAGHGWVPPEQRSEIKAKQEVEDLLFRADVEEKSRTMSGNERIKEAYRRGKEAR